jgi:hypothetical protein
MLGIITFSLICILVLTVIWYCLPIWFPHTHEYFTVASKIDKFLNIPDSQLYQAVDASLKPSSIQYQIPIAQNQLTDVQLQALDTDVLRNTRTLVNFSLTDELNFYQMYNLLKQFKDHKYDFKYSSPNAARYKIIESERLIELNTGAINNTDLDLFYRLKLELISAFNNLVIKNGYYLPFHQYQFFKIINSNLISTTPLQTSSKGMNYVMTTTIAREFKYQQFVLYWDIDLLDNGNGTQTAIIKKVELIGIPIPKTIEFHENRKTKAIDHKASNAGDAGDIYQLIKDAEQRDKERSEMLDIYRNQVSDSATYDVQPSGDGKMFQSSATKFIDTTETSDMSPVLFDGNSLNGMIENKIMNHARDQQFHNHRCYGLVNGVSKELVEYNDNPIFCKSYHPEIAQVGVWDAPCQVNTDCPFYQANKNYPNEFGKCNKQTGNCEMPVGVIPLGFTKYGKLEPQCYNCKLGEEGALDNRCCGVQAAQIASSSSSGGSVNTASNKIMMKSPDYIFMGDESIRRQYASELEKNELKVNPSI